MADKTLNTRIKHKIDTAENWSKSVYVFDNGVKTDTKKDTPFTPLKGELIIYTFDNMPSQVKIGDGSKDVEELDFESFSTMIKGAEVWEQLAVTFKPYRGQIIIYEYPDKAPRFKVGDGTNYVGALAFIDSNSALNVSTVNGTLIDVIQDPENKSVDSIMYYTNNEWTNTAISTFNFAHKVITDGNNDNIADASGNVASFNSDGDLSNSGIAASNVQLKNNIATTFTAESQTSNSQYPSAKLTYDSIEAAKTAASSALSSAVSTLNTSISTTASNASTALSTAVSTLSNDIDNVREVAAGKTEAYVIDDTVMTVFNSANNTITLATDFTEYGQSSLTPTELSVLNIGDNFYVMQTDVPDRWVSAINRENNEVVSVTLSILETAKVAINAITVNGQTLAHNNSVVAMPIETTITSSSSNNNLATAKAVYDYTTAALDTIAAALVGGAW